MGMPMEEKAKEKEKMGKKMMTKTTMKMMVKMGKVVKPMPRPAIRVSSYTSSKKTTKSSAVKTEPVKKKVPSAVQSLSPSPMMMTLPLSKLLSPTDASKPLTVLQRSSNSITDTGMSPVTPMKRVTPPDSSPPLLLPSLPLSSQSEID